jgi:hypothetical protein
MSGWGEWAWPLGFWVLGEVAGSVGLNQNSLLSS